MVNKKCQKLTWGATGIWIATFLWFLILEFPYLLKELSVADVMPTDNALIVALAWAFFIYPVEPLVLFGVVRFLCRKEKDSEEPEVY